jgi:hypothetical protein
MEREAPDSAVVAVIAPDDVRNAPLTMLNVGLLAVPTAWPIDIAPPDIVTPVPAV